MGSCLSNQQRMLGHCLLGICGEKKKLAIVEEKNVQHEEVLYDFMKNDGLIRMINGDANNSFQSVLQVMLECEPLIKHFILEKLDGELFLVLKQIFNQAYLNNKNL